MVVVTSEILTVDVARQLAATAPLRASEVKSEFQNA